MGGIKSCYGGIKSYLSGILSHDALKRANQEQNWWNGMEKLSLFQCNIFLKTGKKNVWVEGWNEN